MSEIVSSLVTKEIKSAILEDESSYCGRIIPQWRMVPALLALIACVTAVAIAVITHHYNLAVPFGVAATASLYLMYLAYHYGNLHKVWSNLEKVNKQLSSEVNTLSQENGTFRTNNTQLDHNVHHFQSENNRLTDQVNTLNTQTSTQKETIARLENHSTTLQNQVTTFEAQITDLKQQIATLNKTNSDLTATLEAFHKLLTGESHSLDTLNSEITQLRETARREFTDLNAVTERCQKRLQEIVTSATLNREAGESATRAMGTLQATVANFTSLFKDLLTQEGVRQNLQTLSELAQQEGLLKASIETLEVENIKLREIETKLAHHVKELETQVNRLKQHNAS